MSCGTRLRSAVPGLILVVVSVGVFAGLALPVGPVVAAPAAFPSTADPQTGHPALRGFELAGEALPASLFLVRTRGELPAGATGAGIVVHGRRGGVFLVSGDPDVVLGLAGRGCAVIPVGGTPRQPRAAPRQWAPLDTPDPDIEALVAQVQWAGVSSRIQWLADFGTRYTLADNHRTVADSIAAAFAGLGLSPVLRPFNYGLRTKWNVEATQVGTVYPDSFVVICGHYDSTSESPKTDAPGADDDGSGTAAVITAAEICTPHDFEYSIRYVCFAGEEQGLLGSQAYAAWAAANGLAIVGVLNFDMVGWWQSGVPKDLEIETNVASQWLAAVVTNCADLYTDAAYELHVDDGAWWGDHASFWDEGYAAVNHEEAWDWGDPDLNPNYHTTSDLVAYLDPDFTVDNIQIGVAALATLAVLAPDQTGVEDPLRTPPSVPILTAAPNPFSGRVAFSVAGLPEGSRARVLIFDAEGRRVGSVPVPLRHGQGMALWNIEDAAPEGLASGVYFARLAGVADGVGGRPVKIVLRR